MNSCCQTTNGACQTPAASQNETTTTQAARSERGFRPAVDIVETAENFTIITDVPGTDASQIEATFDDGVLTVRGAVPARHTQGTRWLVREYGVGTWERAFRIGEGIDASRIAAVCTNGVLTLTLPKAEHARAHKIEVRNS